MGSSCAGTSLHVEDKVMPIYQYTCKLCDASVELIQKISDPAPAACKECKAKDCMEKIISPISKRKVDKSMYSGIEEDLPASAHEPFSKPRDPSLVKDDHGHWIKPDPDAEKITKSRKKDRKAG